MLPLAIWETCRYGILALAEACERLLAEVVQTLFSICGGEEAVARTLAIAGKEKFAPLTLPG